MGMVMLSVYTVCGQNDDKQQDIRRVRQILAQDSLRESLRPQYLNRLSSLYWYIAPDSSRAIAQRAIALATKLGQKIEVGQGWSNIGVAFDIKGLPKASMKAYQKALATFREVDDQEGVANCLGNIGIIHKNQGQYEKAIDLYQQSLQIHQRLDNKVQVANIKSNIGNLKVNTLNAYAEGFRDLQDALLIRQELDQPGELVKSYENIAAFYYSIENYDSAKTYFQNSLRLSKKVPDQYGIAFGLYNLGNIARQQEKPERALSYYQSAQKAARQLRSRYTEVEFQHAEAELLIDGFDRHKEAESLLEEGLVKARQIGYNRLVRNYLTELARLYDKRGNPQRAIDSAEVALALLQGPGNLEGKSTCYELLYGAYHKLNNDRLAFRYLKRFQEVGDSLNNRAKARAVGRVQAEYTFNRQKRRLEAEQALLENEKRLQAAQINRQRTVIAGASVGVVLVSLLAGVTIRNYRRERSTKELLALRNREIQQQRDKLHGTNKELRNSNQVIQKQRRKLKATLAQNMAITRALDRSAMVAITDQAGRIEKVNNIFEQVTGYRQEEVHGRSVRMLREASPDETSWADLWTTVQAGQAWRSEVAGYHRHGDRFWLDLVMNPILDRNGHIIRYLCVGYLVTERKEAELKIQAQQRALEMANEELKSSNDKITASISYAQRIQEAILPSPPKMQDALPEHFVFFRPRDLVSGDFYWLHDQRHVDGKIVLAALDCTDHGVPGAFMSMVGHSLLDHIVKEKGITRPDLIMEALDEAVRDALNQEETQNRDGMDAALITWNAQSRCLQFCGAKNPLVYGRKGTVRQLKGDRRSIGGPRPKKQTPFTCQELAVDDPLTVYLFSDGFQDQFGGEEGKKFKALRLRETLGQMTAYPMAEQAQRLSCIFDQWRGAFPQIDDVLVLGVRFH